MTRSSAVAERPRYALCLAMHADNTSDGLSVLAACTSDVKQWYMQNGLQLNPDKSEALIIGTANQLRTVTPAVSSVSVAGVDLPVADELKALGVVLDCRLTFQKSTVSPRTGLIFVLIYILLLLLWHQLEVIVV